MLTLNQTIRRHAGTALLAAMAVSTALAQQPRSFEARQGEALLSRIEAKWAGVMTKIRGWDADALRQFREGYRGYPAGVLEQALAAETFEAMQAALDGHAAVRAQDAMLKAFGNARALGATTPEDAASDEAVEMRKLAAKTLGDDARDLVFIPVTPCTVWDTRFAAAAPQAGAIGNAMTRQFYSHLDGAGGNFSTYGGNPACTEANQTFIGARPYAAMMVVYVNNPVGNGWLTFYRDGDPDPSFATISVYYSPGPTRTQTVISKSSRGYGVGTYDIAVTGRFSTADASASVVGYFLKAVNPAMVTSVDTGLGLTGGPITTSGTISADTTVLQARVSGTCAVGSSIRAIDASGNVTCQADTNAGGTVTTVTASTPLASSGGNTPNISLSGTIPVASGGTGATSLANNGVLVGQGTAAITATAAGASGQVLIGNTGSAPSWSDSLSLNGNLTLVPSTAGAGNIMKGQFSFIHNFGDSNTFIGEFAGNFTMTGSNNTAIGVAAFSSNTTGNGNTASGISALLNNTTGNANTASGINALVQNTTGFGNTANGGNVLGANTSGAGNVASGFNALSLNTTGSSNIAVGYYAGASLTTGNYNIAIGNEGVAAEGSTIRIGTAGNQTRAFMAGIRGVTTGLGDAVAVLVDSAGQLGTVSSSRRFKEDVADMREASAGLMRLRPVTFHYKSDAAPSGRLQYGLVAEEVAEVYPGLVARSADGEIETVMYQFLPTMLLNEYQKQQRTIEEQRHTIEALSREVAELRGTAAEVAELKRRTGLLAGALEALTGDGAIKAALRRP